MSLPSWLRKGDPRDGTGESQAGRLPTAARLFVAGLGVAALVIGLRAAWLAPSATAALIVGAVLVLAALVLSTEWEELTGRFRDASVTVKRTPRPPNVITMDEIAVLLATAASDEIGEGEPTEELEQLRARVRELSTAAAEAAQFDEAEVEFLMEERERSQAFHQLRDEHAQHYPSATRHNRPPYPHYSLGASYFSQDMPRLTITFTWWGDWRILCEVTSPTSGSFPPLLIDHFMKHGGVPHWIATYPDDFRWARTLEPGTYVFKWSRVVVASKPGELLEEDEVEITESMLEEIEDPMKSVTLAVRRRYGPNVDTTGLIS